MTSLSESEFEAPTSDDDTLSEEEIETYLAGLNRSVWTVVEDHHLEGRYDFDDFAGAMAFANDVGDLAEELWHHPTLQVSFGEVIVELWTHEVGGLHRADFVMAARIDDVYGDHRVHREATGE